MASSTQQAMNRNGKEVGATRAGLLSRFGNLRIAETEITCEVEFTFATLVADWDRYADCLNSFAERGFTAQNTEFLAFDNSEGNRADGFSWLRATLAQARGRYIVFCHDDVEALDDFETLTGVLEHLETHDDRWMIAGNAGQRPALFDNGKRKHTRVRYLSHKPGKLDFKGSLPERVESLDENFFVLRRDRAPVGSIDLDGFHFYGPDLCLNAEIMGGHAYVVPFAVWHKSKGSYAEAFLDARDRFRAKFARFFPGRVYRSTTTTIHFGLLDWIAALVRPAAQMRRAPVMPVTKPNPRGMRPWHVLAEVENQEG
ncbi:hypothetical protein [Sagittula sp. S175]|uniref:hypothetical protein n=1 Tax=Sagittula sp. S175 TaxID=3415129 RepID=UPI003C7B1A6D